ncbi:hypothetical protein [Jiella sp. M17.18]|uniref:hypothetical protein n=1 Tax=Jiella sp. M17.18 TaxID=3234247 RepID=UPI0034DF7C32
MNHSVIDWLSLLVLGGGMGVLGQIMRIIVGLKKQMDQASQMNVPTKEMISGARLLISLLIAFVAGALAVLVIPDLDIGNISRDMLLGFAAAGYAGADFIEGFAQKFLPQTETAVRAQGGQASPPPRTAVADPAAAPAPVG